MCMCTRFIWPHLAEDRNKRQAVVKMTMKLRIYGGLACCASIFGVIIDCAVQSLRKHVPCIAFIFST